jgi:tetratricopeptide (TPR) repeat protein
MDRLSKNDPAGNLVYFQRAAAEFSNSYKAYHAIGLAQLRLGHEEEAQQAFQKSIDASGGHYAEAHFGLSAILYNQQKFTEAEPIIRKALELAPGLRPGPFHTGLGAIWAEPSGRSGTDSSYGVDTRSEARSG